MKKFRCQAVGWGYIDCICPMENVSEFIDAINTLSIRITGFTWWRYVTDGHIPCGMGGPKNRYGPGWYSEICTMEIYEFPNNEAIRTYLLKDWPCSKNYKPCYVPAFWLDVPNDWKNSEAEKQKRR